MAFDEFFRPLLTQELWESPLEIFGIKFGERAHGSFALESRSSRIEYGKKEGNLFNYGNSDSGRMISFNN